MSIVLVVSEQTRAVYVHCVLGCSLYLSRLEMSVSIHCVLVVSEQTRDAYTLCVLVVSEQTGDVCPFTFTI